MLVENKPDACPPHKWIYRMSTSGSGHEYMVCEACRLLAGTGLLEENDRKPKY